MWTAIHISHNPTAADQIKSLLEQEGIMVSLRHDSGVTEVLVSELEAEEAHEIMADKMMLHSVKDKRK
ncbi:MAG: glutamate decarboxylase [Peptococcaceae bacterium]|jgi:hypothetical protein|nr:glutamate decarboxylase [Peptococcaceae bacterium]